MNRPALFSVHRCAAVTRAEFLKIWASKIPLAILVALPIGTHLFILELYHVERMTKHRAIASAIQALPIVFFATWKTLLFQAAMLTFAAFWSTVDSQYGMVRVGCCQPLTRTEYLLGKWAGIGAHIVLFSVALVRFTLGLVVRVVAISVVAMAAASCRRTIGSGIVTALMAFILLALITMLPFDVGSPRFLLLRYFFYPLQELAVPSFAGADSPFRRPEFLTSFYTVAVATPLLVAAPAALYFSRRDIVE